MATRHLWKASILTALLLFAPTVAADDSSNTEDGGQTVDNGDDGPCAPVFISIVPPDVDPHPECLPIIGPILP